MNISFEIPFQCPENIAPHLQKVFSGEYDVRVGLTGGRTILDLGANYGSFALWATHRWPGSIIHAYEPHPETYKGLIANTENFPNITTYNYGVGDPGWRILHDGKYNDGERSFHSIINNPHATGTHLEVRSPLDLPEADIIKLDIEGCEMEVLLPLIEQGRDFELILLEYHSEELRRKIDLLLEDYSLVGSEVQHAGGRGVVKYMRSDLHRGVYGL